MTADEAIYHTILDEVLHVWHSPEELALNIQRAIAPYTEYAPHGGHR